MKGRRKLGGARLPAGPAGEARWVGVLCGRCGALLPPEESTGRLHDKVSQLAQFGLTGAALPLLRTVAQGAEDG